MVSGAGFFSHVTFGTQKSLNGLALPNQPADRQPFADSGLRLSALLVSAVNRRAALLPTQTARCGALSRAGPNHSALRGSNSSDDLERRVKATAWGIGATQRHVSSQLLILAHPLTSFDHFTLQTCRLRYAPPCRLARAL